jgi:hypothetical protein
MNDTNLNLSHTFEFGGKKPSAQELVNILLETEKKTHKEKKESSFKEFIGTWRLGFITGTNNSGKKFTNIIGSGFYLPPFINIYLSYSLVENTVSLLEYKEEKGEIANTVNIGLVKITLTGPAKFISKKNIMAFDFNHLTLSVLGIKIYSTDIRGGKSSQKKFYEESIKKQAFFTYFLREEKLVAARGRGGGLAVWQKKDS